MRWLGRVLTRRRYLPNGTLRPFLPEHPQLVVTLLHQVVRRFRSVVTCGPEPDTGPKLAWPAWISMRMSPYASCPPS